MRGALVLVLVGALLVAQSTAQTIPAVYYKIYYITRFPNGTSLLETVDANGGGMGTIAQMSGRLEDSLAFNGSYLFAVQNRREIVRYTAGIPPLNPPAFPVPENTTCVGIGHPDRDNTGRSVLYYGVAGSAGGVIGNQTNSTSDPTPATLYQMEMDGSNVTKLAEWGGGECQYVVQQRELILWTTNDGNLWQWNTTSRPASATMVPSAAPGNLTGPVTTVQGSNLLLFAASDREIRANNLDEVLLVEPGPPVDRVWTTVDGNTTHCLISLNGAVVASGDLGITLWFGPFSEGSAQSVARTILTDRPYIRGLATDTAAIVGAWALVVAAAVALMAAAM